MSDDSGLLVRAMRARLTALEAKVDLLASALCLRAQELEAMQAIDAKYADQLATLQTAVQKLPNKR